MLGVPRAPIMMRVDLTPPRNPGDQHATKLQIPTESPPHPVPDRKNRRHAVHHRPPDGLMRPNEVARPGKPVRISVTNPNVRTFPMRRLSEPPLRPIVPDIRVGIQFVQQRQHWNLLSNQCEVGHVRIQADPDVREDGLRSRALGGKARCRHPLFLSFRQHLRAENGDLERIGR